MRVCTNCGSKDGIRVDNKIVCNNCLMTVHTFKRVCRHLEENIQIEFFYKVRAKYKQLGKLLFAVPNGGSRNKIEAANMKLSGTTPGVADVILLMPNKQYSSLCIEFKAGKGKQSEEQLEFQKQAEKAGNKYVVAYSADEAIEFIREYIT